MAASRSQPWLESLGDWAWPGGTAAAAEALLAPPPWVASLPPAHAPAPDRLERTGVRPTSRALLLAVLLGLLGAVCCALALKGSLTMRVILGRAPGGPPTPAASQSFGAAEAPLPVLEPVSRDSAGSSIDRASFSSPSLSGQGSFLAYLPPGYSRSQRYPVLYLLHGQDGHATAFLEVGLQHTLDGLIERERSRRCWR